MPVHGLFFSESDRAGTTSAQDLIGLGKLEELWSKVAQKVADQRSRHIFGFPHGCLQ